MNEDNEPVHTADPPGDATCCVSRKRWTTPQVILSEMALQQVGAPVNPAVAPFDVKGATTNSGDGS
jgi:hypothetical protein